jgi:hypothetical protein
MQSIPSDLFNGVGTPWSGAHFSPCAAWRYTLWREWRHDAPQVTFVMLNPSTADESKNDPTVERCERRARLAGYGRLEVVNIFALRSTDPAALYKHADPIGPGNDEAIAESVRTAQMVVCGWGSHGAYLNRGLAVLRLIRALGKVPHALRRNQDGSPGHPLYVPYELTPQPMMECA